MSSNTESFIRKLADDVQPVRPLSRPYIRAAIWLTISVFYIGVVLFVMRSGRNLPVRLSEPVFLLEQCAALATGIAAAVAAFTTVVPGRNRKWIMLPMLSLAVWLGSLGPACVAQLEHFGPQGLALNHDLWCFPSIVLLGGVPAVAIAVMLREGAPLTPRLTAGLGGLASAGLGNVGVRIVHPEDVTVMLLVWHVGCVMALSALAGVMGEYFLNWRHIKYVSRSSGISP